MPELRELYQDLILEHSKAPRNYRELVSANRKAEGFNPLCGDRYTIYVELDGDAIRNVTFQGSGCAISKASASLMTQAVKGKTQAEFAQFFEEFHNIVTGQTPVGDPTTVGKLAVFAGVSAYPVRVKCASLAWHTLRAALAGEDQPVSTE
jgi:nitrogen fixation NifU-like protein